jgi:hypothetical protein
MKKKLPYIVSGLLIFIAGLYLFFDRLINLPPGCRTLNKDIIGGCFGKNLNRNLRIIPGLPDCLKIKTNNCLSARLEIENSCPTSTRITVADIPINDKYTYLSFGLDGQGIVSLLNSDNNLYPSTDEHISLNLKIDNSDYLISYIRTKPFCE